MSEGETLSVIASQYGVSMARLARANGLRAPYRLRVGQVLDLPGRPGAAAPAAVLAQADRPAAPPKQATPPTGVVGTENRDVVRRGDTLSRIAKRNTV